MTRPAPTPAPAIARKAVARYLPGEPEGGSFARMLGAYARCAGGCLDRAEGNAECWEICRRAKAAARRRA